MYPIRFTKGSSNSQKMIKHERVNNSDVLHLPLLDFFKNN